MNRHTVFVIVLVALLATAALAAKGGKSSKKSSGAGAPPVPSAEEYAKQTKALDDSMYSGKVIDLTKDTFMHVFEPDRAWIVEFFAPWCGHCQRLAPAYKKAAESLKGLVYVAAVNCDEEKELCGSAGIEGFPTLKMFGPEVEAAGDDKEMVTKTPIPYNGAREMKPIVDACIRMLPDHVVSVTDKKADDFFAQKEPKLVLFTEKKKTPPILKAVSSRIIAKVAEVRSGEKATVARFGVEKFPTLMLVRGSDDPVQTYSGELSALAIEKWLVSHNIETVRPQPIQPEPAQVYEIKTPVEYENHCGSSSKSKACALLFRDPTIASDDEKYRTMLLEFANDMQTQFKIKFVLVDGTQQYEFMEKLGVSGLPGFLVVRPATNEYSTYVGPLESKEVLQYLNRVVERGLVRRSAGFKKIAKLPSFVEPVYSSGDDSEDVDSSADAREDL